MLPPPPPPLSNLVAGTQLVAGMGHATVLADLDFETYSPAGFIWDNAGNCWKPPHGAREKGLPAVGVAVYTEHPDAEVISLAYDLKQGAGRKLWLPTQPPPYDLLAHVMSGYLLEAWNASFEYYVWNNICVRRYGFPPLSLDQLRCAAAKARAHALPGSLDAAGDVLNVTHKKDKRGKQLIQLLSVPKNPTKKDPTLRRLPNDPEHAELFQDFYDYNLRDIEAEAEISSRVPDLNPTELEVWQIDQVINARGVQVDAASVAACIVIIEQAYAKYNAELAMITGGEVTEASKLAQLIKWMATQGVQTGSLDEDHIDELLKTELPSPVKRALEIRQRIGSAAVKKLYSMQNQMSRAGRLHNLFVYHSARTGRAAGAGPQPQNLPNGGPSVWRCNCGKHFYNPVWCHGCNTSFSALRHSLTEWNPQAVEDALETIGRGYLAQVEAVWGDALPVVSGCLRGLFIASPGYDLICSDYKAIEAVVLAALAGEEWRLDVFRTHGMIYELSASKITGVPFEEFVRHKKETGQHHQLRKTVGKVAELASGFGGWVGAWKAFGADAFFTEDEIKRAILAWRAASPAIVEFWGGQQRNWKPELYGIEGAAIQAVMYPGREYSHNGITYVMRGDALYCRLLSGRYLTYHRPQLTQSTRREGTLSLSYEGWNSNPTYGAMGWQRIETYSGRLVENCVQATARDILMHAVVNLERAGYKVVLHIHDEIVAEIPEGKGSVEEFEQIMATLPTWAAGWPVKAAGGWRAKRYSK